MNETDETIQTPPEGDEIRPMGVLQRTFGVFNSPQKTLEDIAARPNWLFPLILIDLLSMVGMQVVMPALLEEMKTNPHFEKLLDSGQLTPEQYEQARENQLKGTKSFAAVGAGITTILATIFVTAIILFAGNVIMGGSAKFAQVFSIYCWVGLIGLLGFLVRIPIQLQKLSMKVYFSPAVLFSSEAEQSALFKIAAALDVFLIWQLVVLAIGFAALYKFPFGKSLAMLSSLFALRVAGGIILGSFF